MITLTLPWPPTVNSLFPTNRKTGRRFTSKKYELYLSAVKAECFRVGALNAQMSGRLGYTLTLCPPDRRTRDLSNYQKAIEDCLTKCGVWVDDSQVDYLQVKRGAATGGMAHIVIWDLKTDQALAALEK